MASQTATIYLLKSATLSGSDTLHAVPPNEAPFTAASQPTICHPATRSFSSPLSKLTGKLSNSNSTFKVANLAIFKNSGPSVSNVRSCCAYLVRSGQFDNRCMWTSYFLSLSLLFLYFCSDLRLTFYCTCMIRDTLRLKCNNIHLRLLVVPIPSSSSTCHPFAVRKTHVSSRPEPRPTSAGSWDCENG